MSVTGVSDDVVISESRASASSMQGAMWPNNEESYEYVPEEEYDTEETRAFTEEMTRRGRNAIGSYEGRFNAIQPEYWSEQVDMGTSGIFVEEDETSNQYPFRFRACSVETCVIDEDAYGCVDTVYFEYNWSARQVVERYGYENCSPRVQGLYSGQRYDDYVKVVLAVEPRQGGKAGYEKTKKPYKLVHWEYESQWLLLEDGTDDKPVFMTRFRKLPMELYGRSLGMDALASAKELNMLRGAFTQAMMLILRPPMGYYHDQIAGGGNFNMSPGARVALYNTGRIPQGQMPITPLISIQLPPAAEQRIQNLTETISAKFLNDILADLGNHTRMTANETQERVALRQQSLSGIFARQFVELYYPLIKHCTGRMFIRGLFGMHPVRDQLRIQMLRNMGQAPLVIPTIFAQAMAQGKTPYKIRFISPAARAMQSDALMGLDRLTNYGLALTNAGALHIADNFNGDRAFRDYQYLAGAPSTVIMSWEKVQKVRKQRDATMAAAQQMQQALQKAEIAKAGGKATLDYAKAGQPNPLQQQPQQGADQNQQWLQAS